MSRGGSADEGSASDDCASLGSAGGGLDCGADSDEIGSELGRMHASSRGAARGGDRKGAQQVRALVAGIDSLLGLRVQLEKKGAPRGKIDARAYPGVLSLLAGGRRESWARLCRATEDAARRFSREIEGLAADICGKGSLRMSRHKIKSICFHAEKVVEKKREKIKGEYADHAFYIALVRNYCSKSGLGVCAERRAAAERAPRACKARELSYKVHESLVAFLAPCGSYLWEDKKMGDFYSSLLCSARANKR